MIQTITNVVTLLLGIGLFFYAETLPKSILAGTKEFIGPAFFPRIVGVLLSLLSLIHLLVRILSSGAVGSPEVPVPAKPSLKPDISRVAISVGLFALVVFLIPRIGFYASTFFYVTTALIFLTGLRDRRRNRISFIIGTCVIAAIYFLFERLLWVVPPRGILF